MSLAFSTVPELDHKSESDHKPEGTRAGGALSPARCNIPRTPMYDLIGGMLTPLILNKDRKDFMAEKPPSPRRYVPDVIPLLDSFAKR